MAPCLVGRVSYTGDLGYEIWVAPEYQRAAYQTLMAAGEDFGIGLFGVARAQCAAAGEELRLVGARIPADLRAAGGWARPFRRLRERSRFHRQAGGTGRAPARRQAAAARLCRRCGRRRRHRRRADLVRRRRARLGHVRRLRAPFKDVRGPGLCAEGDRRRGRRFRDRTLGQALCRPGAADAAVRRESRADARVMALLVGGHPKCAGSAGQRPLVLPDISPTWGEIGRHLLTALNLANVAIGEHQW